MKRGALLALIGVAACGGGGLPSDGAVQLSKGPVDPAVSFYTGSWWLGDAVVWARGTGGDGLREIWTQALDGAAPVLIDENVDLWRLTGGSKHSADAVAIATVHWDRDDDRIQQIRIQPRDGSAPFTIERALRGKTYIPDLEHCQTVRLADDGITGQLWRGPCGALQPAAAGLDVVDHNVGADGHTFVLARSAGETGLGIHDVAPDGRTTLVVPPVLAAYDALPGAPPPETVQSTTLTVADGIGVGHACWQGRCYLLYSRVLADDAVRSFIMPLESGREQLPPGSSSSPLLNFQFITEDVRAFAWASASGTGTRLHLWDLQGSLLKSCDTAPASWPLLAGVHAWDTYVLEGGATVVNGLTVAPAGDEPCGAIDQPIHTWTMSEDGTAMAWLGGTAEQMEVWAADGSGRNVRQITTTPWVDSLAFAGSDLLVETAAPDGELLSLVRLDGSQPAAVPLAQGVFGSPRLLGPGRLLVGTSYIAQDGSGDLSLIDLASGHREVLASGVAFYWAEDDAVLYWVRGRYASERDGLWLRRLP